MALVSLKNLLSKDQNGAWFSARLDHEKHQWEQKHEKAQQKAKNAIETRWKRVREEKAKHAEKSTQGDTRSITQVELKNYPSPSPVSTNTTPFATLRGIHVADSGAGSPGPGKGEEMGKKPKKARNSPRSDSGLVEATQHPPAASDAASPPQRVTLHGHVKLHGSGKRVTSYDPRFSIFKAHLMRFYGAANGEPPEDTPWGTKEDRALVARLMAQPKLSEADLSTCLGHRLDAIRICMDTPSRKNNVNPRDPITQVLDRLPLYKDGPVDAFGVRLNMGR